MERGGEAPLVQALVDLAVLPDDAPELGELLARLVELVVLRLPAADFASVTSQRGDGFATVALTGELALAVDQAQYADGVGPCIDATDGFVTAVTDTATTMQWPGFRETAVNLGLRSSLSIPLFTASGVPSIGLNIYSYRPAALAALGVMVENELHLRPAGITSIPPSSYTLLDDGGQEMLRGMSCAMEIRNLIQRAVGVVMERDRTDAGRGYVALRVEAAEAGLSILEQAEALTARPA
jgi:hypothetical protein